MNLLRPSESVDIRLPKISNTIQLCVDFIPIFLVYFLLSDTRQFVVGSGTALGKLVAISIIVFYTSVNTMYGLFVCLSILLYYQTDFVEEILNMERGEWMESELMKMSELVKYSGRVAEGVRGNSGERSSSEFVQFATSDRLRKYSIFDRDGLSPENLESGWVDQAGPSPVYEHTTIANIPPVKINLLRQKESTAEGFSANDPAMFAYVPERSYRGIAEDLLDKKDRKSELMNIFRNEHCEKGVLLHREMEVNPEMSDHIFREIKFDDTFRKCNPCDPTCAFSIVEEKLNTETRLQTPVRSNDMMESIQDAFATTTATLYGYIPNLLPPTDSATP